MAARLISTQHGPHGDTLVAPQRGKSVAGHRNS